MLDPKFKKKATAIDWGIYEINDEFADDGKSYEFESSCDGISPIGNALL